jgi:inward rectifier potassium channel
MIWFGLRRDRLPIRHGVSLPLVPRREPDGTMRVQFGAYELAKRGAPRYDFRDPYYLAIALSWPWFLLFVVVTALILNTAFAGLYMLQPGSVLNARSGVFLDHFFFSIETLATVGYGAMSPNTLYGHTIASIEVICGMGYTALATGLALVRFSRPRSKVVYAEKIVITLHRGRRTLMIRVANGRLTPLTDASARLSALLAETTPEGQFYRSIHELELLQPRLPIFALTWTIMHDMGEASPLHGFTPERIAKADLRLFLTLEARDPMLAAVVHETHSYGPEDFEFGKRYADAVSIDDQGRPIADLTRVSTLEPEVRPDGTELGGDARREEESGSGR